MAQTEIGAEKDKMSDIDENVPVIDLVALQSKL